MEPIDPALPSDPLMKKRIIKAFGELSEPCQEMLGLVAQGFTYNEIRDLTERTRTPSPVLSTNVDIIFELNCLDKIRVRTDNGWATQTKNCKVMSSSADGSMKILTLLSGAYLQAYKDRHLKKQDLKDKDIASLKTRVEQQANSKNALNFSVKWCEAATGN